MGVCTLAWLRSRVGFFVATESFERAVLVIILSSSVALAIDLPGSNFSEGTDRYRSSDTLWPLTLNTECCL